VSDNGHRVSFSIIDQFFDHTLGAAVGFAQLNSPVQEKQYQAGYWEQDNGNAASANLPPPAMRPLDQCCGTPTVVGVPPLAIEEEYSSAYARSESQVRNGLMSVLEWAPNEHYHSQLDLFYSKFKEVNYTNGVQWSSAPWGGTVGNPPTPFPIPSYSNVTTSNQNGNAIVTGGIVSGIVPIMSNSYSNTATQNFSAGWNNKVTFDNDWTVAGDLSYSSARDKLHGAYAFSGVKGSVVNGIGFQIPVNNGYPHFSVPVNLADPSVVGFTDPANYSYDGRDEWDRQSDVIKAFRLDIVHPVGWIFKTVDVGFDYSDRKKIKAATVNFAYLLGNGCNTSASTAQCTGGPPYNSNVYTPINSNLLYSPTSLSYVGIPGVQDYNVLSALSKQFYEVPDMGGNDYNRNYYVEEKVPLGYVKLNIDTTLASVAIRGNVGVQVVHTKQFSSSVLTDPNTGQPIGSVTGGTSYNEVLPSLNLVGDFGNRTLLRFGAGKEMMRGRIDDEKSAASASVCTNIASGCIPGTWSGSGGNPKLKPYIAIAEDLSFEKVFGQASYFSAALFNKNLTSYIFQQSLVYDFSGFTSPVPAISKFGLYSTPQDGSGGKIQGYELALTLEGNLLGSWLDGFGMQSSFSYTNNFIPLNTLSNVPGGPTTFPGFSKKVAALTLYYEKYGFSVRAAATYRSDFTGEIIANFNQLSYTEIKGETVTNLQAGYEFKRGGAKGLSVLLQVNNLTNSPYQTSQVSNFNVGTVVTPLEYDTFGRTILLGVNYKIQ
jgi:TonB-dependent receptor